ncbi:N-acetyltransferase family protein [Xylanimonas protaetiae]|uniref:N-acetyltransferase family protein n=1 Tax=Xylanimonas protaetiae TaxID=2509457 RepID=A0A4P6FBL3_9MICO|nr:N-acetyltransferase family protein [Xylanimonas protaetiae]
MPSTGGDATTVAVRPLAPADWPAVEAVYREGIAGGHATFEATPPTWAEFDAAKHPALRLVATTGDDVVGWAAAGPVSSREVYRGVVEHSLYVARAARGRGVGGLLLDALVAAADDAGAWTLQSGIFPENTASLRLHATHGFRVVGRRERIGLMTYGPLAGQWRDTILVERRAP